MTSQRAENAPIGILGGTFDPIHNGHLRLAMELASALSLAEVRLVPCARPPHRESPGAAPGQRAKWIRVAVGDEPQLRLDDRELLREGPSYTVDTLASLRAENPNTPLCLIMGREVYAHLPSWHEWQRLFDYAHIVLIDRPGVDVALADAARTELDARVADNLGQLHRETAGRIYSHAPPLLEISATRIRALLASGASPRYLLPTPVLEDIMDAGAYRSNPATST